MRFVSAMSSGGLFIELTLAPDQIKFMPFFCFEVENRTTLYRNRRSSRVFGARNLLFGDCKTQQNPTPPFVAPRTSRCGLGMTG
jgi:hypothetical protein